MYVSRLLLTGGRPVTVLTLDIGPAARICWNSPPGNTTWVIWLAEAA
jgi:hypothetical protein